MMLLFLLCITGTSFAQNTEQRDAVGKFQVVPSVMVTKDQWDRFDLLTSERNQTPLIQESIYLK